MLVLSDELAENAKKFGADETIDLFSFMQDDDIVSDEEINIDSCLKAEFFKFLQDRKSILDSLKDNERWETI